MVPTNPASPLSDVIRCVRDIFSGIGDATPIQVGKGYLESFGAGTASRVLLVPDPKGQAGDPPTGTGGTGYVAGVAHGCAVYVRGAEDGSDEGRLDSAYLLADRAMNAILRAARGRIAFEGYDDDSPIPQDAYGADIAFRFVYSRGVQRDAAIWSLPASPIAPSPPDIGKPPGADASTVEPLAITVTPAP